MNITSVEFHPEGSTQVVVLSFRDPRRLNPYNIKGLEGLDVDEVRPRHYSGSGSLGKKFQNLSPGKKEVVALIELNPNFATNDTYSDLRDDLYRMIQSSRTGMVQIQFKYGSSVVAAISGFVSKLESALMTQTPSVQITFDCGNAMLKAPIPVDVDISDLEPDAFTLTDMVSTSHHGFAMNINIIDPMATFTMTDPGDPDWVFTVSPVGGFEDNDILSFSSDFDGKYLLIIRGVTPIFLGDVLTQGSVWPLIFPGRENNFALANPEKLVLLDVTYYPTFWGV